MKLNLTAPLCALLMAAFLLTACSEEQEATEAVAAPIEQNAVKNLLLICIDTVRTDVFTALNASTSDPLNKWLDDALVYSRAKSSSSWTVPAVGTVFSGLWQYGHGAGQLPSMKIVDGVSTNESMHRPTAVYEGVPLLAEAAKEAGFHTSIISASPWTNDTESRVGLNKGFDENLRIGKNGAKIAYKKMKEALATRGEDQRFFQFMHFMEAHDWHIEPEEKMKERIAAFTPQQREFYLRTAPPTACAEEESMLRKSRDRVNRLISPIAPANSTPVGPAPTMTNVNCLRRSSMSSVTSARSNAASTRRRISVACSIVFNPGANGSH